MSVTDTPRFSRLERLLGEVTGLIRDLNDQDLSGKDHAAIGIAIRHLEVSLDRARATLAGIGEKPS